MLSWRGGRVVHWSCKDETNTTKCYQINKSRSFQTLIGMFHEGSNLADKFAKDHRSNYQFMFLLKFMEMLEMLFGFIASSSSCNWITHLPALKYIMSLMIIMNHIKHRRMLPTYLADMVYLKKSDPVFGNFSKRETLVYKELHTIYSN